ncbi:MAG: LamG domain-containing protein [Opitutaceae bacterium]|jgi:hypothetical protein
MIITRIAHLLLVPFLLVAPAHAAATLTHRYEFAGNINDSFRAADAIDGAKAAVTYDAARPAGASGPVASVRIGQAAGEVSGFTIPGSVLSASGSLGFWFKADRAEAGEGADYLVNMDGTYNKGFRFAIAAGKSRLEANVADTNTQLGNIVANTWHHIAMTWDSVAKTADLYFDGALVKTKTWNDADRFSPSAMRVGNWALSPKYLNNQFNGSIYDFQIYSGRLDAAEVKLLHSTPGAVLGSAPAPGLQSVGG